MKIYSGKLSAKNKKYGIVISRFNDFIGKELLSGATDCLVRHGADEKNIEVAWVPGAFEIPLIASTMAKSQKYDAIICLGVLVRGSTPHFDYIASEVTKGIGLAALQSGVPVAYGVLTCDSLEQAIERAGTKAGNKGWDAALSAIEMADLIEQIK